MSEECYVLGSMTETVKEVREKKKVNGNNRESSEWETRRKIRFSLAKRTQPINIISYP